VRLQPRQFSGVRAVALLLGGRAGGQLPLRLLARGALGGQRACAQAPPQQEAGEEGGKGDGDEQERVGHARGSREAGDVREG
jgi:hypothetical protein